jgi:hypothetical protein
MNETLMETTNSETMGTPPPVPLKRGRRMGKRKMGFRMDTPPWPVRAIWELASEQERKEAHQKGVLMLEHWLGRMSRKDLGTKMDLPPLRVWQMSQQALTGMVVGLMAQPKRPPKGTPMAMEKKIEKEDLKTLRKENHELKEQNRVLQELLNLLKDMPGQMPAAPQAPKGKKISSKTETPNPLAKESRNMAGGSNQAKG